MYACVSPKHAKGELDASFLGVYWEKGERRGSKDQLREVGRTVREGADAER
jgi:hypothetical protein